MDRLSDVMTSLRNASESGDTEGAARLAQIADGLRKGQAAQPQTAQPTGLTPPATSPLKEIEHSAEWGAAANVAAPYILQGAGALSAAAGVAFPPAAPVLEPAAAWLMGAGTAMKATRLAGVAVSALSGAASGAASEALGQVAETRIAKSMGAGENTATAARFAGAFAPSAAGSIIGKFVAKPLQTAWKAMQAYAGSGEVPAAQAVKVAKEKLATAGVTGVPELDLHLVMQQGKAANLQAADEAARAHIAEAHQTAARVVATDDAAAQTTIKNARAYAGQLRADALKQAQVLDEATQGKLATAARVSAYADKELGTVGDHARTISAIGEDLQKVAANKLSADTIAKNTEYKRMEAIRDGFVQQNEKAGITMQSMPEIQSLRADIDKKLLLTQKGAKAAGGFQSVTEAGMRTAYKKVYDAISPVMVEGKLVNPDFKAIDAVRRQLGDVANGKVVEGYGALRKGMAREMYNSLAKAQVEYAGEAQTALQSGYAAAKGELQGFGSKAGKKLVGVDPADANQMLTDAKAIPGHFFSSKRGVENLVELTGGDKGLVEKAAGDYSAGQLAGRGSKQVGDWVAANRDWIQAVPGLEAKLTAYGKKLEGIQKFQGGQAAVVKGLEAERAGVSGKAQTLAEKHMEEARTAATKQKEGSLGEAEKYKRGQEAEAMGQQQKQVADIEKVPTGGYHTEDIDKAFRSKDPEVLKRVAAYAAGTPGGKDALIGSSRRWLAGVKSAEDLKTAWEVKMKPTFQTAKIGTPEELALLDKHVGEVLKAYEGPKAVSMAQKLIRGFLVGSGTAAAGIAQGH